MDVDELVETHLPIVGYAVAEVASRLPHYVDKDDLRSAAMLALVQAARSFDPRRGVPFALFAKSRLRGAIIDELRGRDWVTRGVRVKARQRAQAEDELAVRLGRYPSPREVARHLEISLDELTSIEGDVHRSVVLSLQGFSDAGTLEGMLPTEELDPEDALLDRERTSYLLAAIDALPHRLRVVVRDYFLDERPMAEIAVELGVSESRISQMRAEALTMLRDGMNAMLAPERLEAPENPEGCVARRKAAYIEAIGSRIGYHARIGTSHATALRAVGAA